jgi:hypothetical protein
MAAEVVALPNFSALCQNPTKDRRSGESKKNEHADNSDKDLRAEEPCGCIDFNWREADAGVTVDASIPAARTWSARRRPAVGAKNAPS